MCRNLKNLSIALSCEDYVIIIGHQKDPGLVRPKICRMDPLLIRKWWHLAPETQVMYFDFLNSIYGLICIWGYLDICF